MQIEWTGDLSDDCFARLGDVTAHVEALGEIHMAELNEQGKPSRSHRHGWYTVYWHIGVYRGGEPLYDSSESGGMITGDGGGARAIAEAVMRAAWKGQRDD